VINYCGVASTETYFLDAVSTGSVSHTGEYICQGISAVIDDLEKQDVVVYGCCTDNASNNTSAWKLLKEKYPAKHFYGCVCHSLHLLVKDIVNHDNMEWFRDTASVAIEASKAIKRSHLLNAKFSSLVKDKNEKKLVIPCETRWGSTLECMKRVFASIESIRKVLRESDFVATGPSSNRTQRTKLFNKVCRDSTWTEYIVKCIEILDPINELIVKFQNDSVSISDVYHEMIKLRELATNSSWKSKDDVEELINSRFDFIYADCHGLAYLLDPRYMGDKLELDVRQGCQNWMIELSQNNENVVIEHTNFIEMIRNQGCY
jgi:Protein of unknown function (DUF 659)